jgi:ATP-dependent helicase/nuclease subunit A
MKLTDEQRKAVEADGSVAVTAGAGTGKTAMLAARFLHHVTEQSLSPVEIVAVTFTEKAAAELRARIRKEMRKTGDERKTAEVDAAQISTIHALAARICRDFYDIAGIPADFRMLDETDSGILMAEWFDEALSVVEPEVVRGLGYTWLREALRILLNDPFAAEEALELGENDWQESISKACENSIRELIESECWKTAEFTLAQYQGSAGDKLEDVRGNVINAMKDIAARSNVAAAFDRAFAGFRSNGGAAKNWPAGLTEVRECLVKLREAFANCKALATLEFGLEDEEVCRRLELLRRAFAAARRYIAGVKLEKKVLDYGDLEIYALKILETRDARDHYAARWKAILVDEFQDTNPVQEKLLERLTESVKLTVVGDGKQSIYGFRRADTRVFDRFRERIGNEVELSRSFRTHGGLVGAMNKMFEPILGSMHQPLEAERTDHPHEEPFVIARYVPKGEGDNVGRMRSVEAWYIAGEIRNILDSGLTVWDKEKREHRPAAPGDIAILSRTRGPLEMYIEALLEAGVPAVNTGGGNLLDTREAKDSMALLQWAADPSDDLALMALLRGPFFAVSDLELFKLTKKRKVGESWWTLLYRSEGDASRAYAVLCRILEASKKISAERLLQFADELTGYTAVIANLEQGERRLADWTGFLALLRRFASLGRSDVLGAERYLREIREAETPMPRPPLQAGDSVSLMTIHGSKGLEWPIVFVPDLARGDNNDTSLVTVDAEVGVAFKVEAANENGKLESVEPAILKLLKQRAKQRDLEEAKRIIYVAVTRARDRVYLTAAGEKGTYLDILRPGLEAAGVALTPLIDVEAVHAKKADGASSRQTDAVVQTGEVAPVLKSIPVTGLEEYAVCPKRFKYQYVDGHPGIGEGAANARLTGVLTHTALEIGCRDAAELSRHSDGADGALIDDAIRLAARFDTDAAFQEFRLGTFAQEVSAQMPLGDLNLSGKADLVGEDYVLDFKTDTEVAPERHSLQLWAYAKALAKPRAVIAYLRHGLRHEYTAAEMESAAAKANEIADAITAGSYPPKPSDQACRRCLYGELCDDRVRVNDIPVEDVF